MSDSIHRLVPYRGQGKMYGKDQIVGFFMLTVSPIADVKYGYFHVPGRKWRDNLWNRTCNEGWRTEQDVQAKLL